MTPKFLVILEQAIEEGVKRGFFRSYKYDTNPSEETVINNISETVMASLYEYFDFND